MKKPKAPFDFSKTSCYFPTDTLGTIENGEQIN